MYSKNVKLENWKNVFAISISPSPSMVWNGRRSLTQNWVHASKIVFFIFSDLSAFLAGGNFAYSSARHLHSFLWLHLHFFSWLHLHLCLWLLLVQEKVTGCCFLWLHLHFSFWGCICISVCGCSWCRGRWQGAACM